MGRGMAGAAAHAGMFPVEQITGLGVIEALGGWVPVQHRKSFAVVVRVALRAADPGRARLRERGVQTMMLLQLVCNLPMAFRTTKRRCLGGDRMALGAIVRRAEALVCPSQRSGRNLCACRQRYRQHP